MKPKILIVEDDLENQKFLRILLRRNFDVELCDSAEDTYKILPEKSFDVILMDISLRGNKDGLQLTKELKSHPTYKPIPIVGLSAHAFARDKDNALKAGIDVFLTKPVDANYLLENLLRVLEKSKANNSK